MLAVPDRSALAARLFFEPGDYQAAMRGDILRRATRGQVAAGTQDELIAHLWWLTERGWILELTMVQTGHHDDGTRGHYGGYAADGWPLNSRTEGDWMDAGTTKWFDYVRDCGLSPYAYQFGAVGDGSDSPDSFHYAAKGFEQRNTYVPGISVFQDDGGAHVHNGAMPVGGW